MVRLIRGKRASIPAVKARLMRDRDKEWTRCRVLATGIGRQLRACYDLETLEDVMSMFSTLQSAAASARMAENALRGYNNRRPVSAATAKKMASMAVK